MVAESFSIRQARSTEDLNIVRTLFKAYTDSLGIDLAFQSYDAELASLPGAYEDPAGALLLAADDDGTALGCMGVRRMPYENPDGDVCEMKRLYVTPAGRGKGVGRALVEAGSAAAKASGYTKMKLDTLATMGAAQALYRRCGFVETDPYYHNPHEGTVYMSRDLTPDIPNQ